MVDSGYSSFLRSFQCLLCSFIPALENGIYEPLIGQYRRSGLVVCRFCKASSKAVGNHKSDAARNRSPCNPSNPSHIDVGAWIGINSFPQKTPKNGFEAKKNLYCLFPPSKRPSKAEQHGELLHVEWEIQHFELFRKVTVHEPVESPWLSAIASFCVL